MSLSNQIEENVREDVVVRCCECRDITSSVFRRLAEHLHQICSIGYLHDIYPRRTYRGQRECQMHDIQNEKKTTEIVGLGEPLEYATCGPT